MAPRDEVIALERIRVTPSNWETQLRRYRPRDSVLFHFFREGVLRECRVTLDEPAVKAVRLTMKRRITHSVAARRCAWLYDTRKERRLLKRELRKATAE
ncbi:hypothetical protein [Hydrogenophilus thermoluteolus]|uniref:hypothetical protein n=1 Tax=Hydrogenophilus thermoluteolus TaxID=297 RepID=UPI003F666A5D